MTTEEWRDVPGYEGLYQVSSLGRVRSLTRSLPWKSKTGTPYVRTLTGRPMKLTRHKRGYLMVGLRRRQKRRTCAVHRLVMSAFVGPRPRDKEVAHYNGRPEDNRLSNLRYATPQENEQDKFRHGTRKRADMRFEKLKGPQYNHGSYYQLKVKSKRHRVFVWRSVIASGWQFRVEFVKRDAEITGRAFKTRARAASFALASVGLA